MDPQAMVIMVTEAGNQMMPKFLAQIVDPKFDRLEKKIEEKNAQ